MQSSQSMILHFILLFVAKGIVVNESPKEYRHCEPVELPTILQFQNIPLSYGVPTNKEDQNTSACAKYVSNMGTHYKQRLNCLI